MFGGGRFEFLDPFAAIGYNVAILGLAPFIIWINYGTENRTSSFLSWKLWLWLGTRSYGIYIWHEIPNTVIGSFGVSKTGMLLRAALLATISIGIAELSWRFIETPFLRRKQKRFISIAGR
jgi:peptidoglycan/LPS O-acetylase OafA/YrhL